MMYLHMQLSPNVIFLLIDDPVPYTFQAVNPSALTQANMQKEKGTEVKMSSGMQNVDEQLYWIIYLLSLDVFK